MNNIKITQTQEEIILNVNAGTETKDVIAELETKIPKLRDFYQSAKIPIRITGKLFTKSEAEIIRKMINTEIETEIKLDGIPDELGLHAIEKTFEFTTDITETRFVLNSIRSGQKEEYSGSLVICGDVNAGAEVIAGGNIVIMGILRGVAHAGANGNKKAVIAANSIEVTQIRISNLVTEIAEKVDKNPICKIKSNKIEVI